MIYLTHFLKQALLLQTLKFMDNIFPTEYLHYNLLQRRSFLRTLLRSLIILFSHCIAYIYIYTYLLYSNANHIVHVGDYEYESRLQKPSNVKYQSDQKPSI